MSDAKLYQTATEEFAKGSVQEDLFAKARVRAKGEESGIEFEYIELRVEQLKANSREKAVGNAIDKTIAKAPAFGSFLWYALLILTVIGFIILLGVAAVGL